MTIEQLFETADKTWPPPPTMLRIVCNRIGTQSEIADKLRLGTYGVKRISMWISGKDEIPFSVWFMLLVVDDGITNA